MSEEKEEKLSGFELLCAVLLVFIVLGFTAIASFEGGRLYGEFKTKEKIYSIIEDGHVQLLVDEVKLRQESKEKTNKWWKLRKEIYGEGG